MNYVVEPLPMIDGNEPRPFAGVQGFYVSGFAENELAAKTFVVDFMGSEEAQLELMEVGNRPPALASAYESATSDDEVLLALGNANGYAMPSIPAMNAVWDAWNQAYAAILSGEDGTATFTAAAEQIRTLIEQ